MDARGFCFKDRPSLEDVSKTTNILKMDSLRQNCYSSSESRKYEEASHTTQRRILTTTNLRAVHNQHVNYNDVTFDCQQWRPLNRYVPLLSGSLKFVGEKCKHCEEQGPEHQYSCARNNSARRSRTQHVPTSSKQLHDASSPLIRRQVRSDISVARRLTPFQDETCTGQLAVYDNGC
jgi:hypothetical protein